jgi:intracellular septation protein
MKQLLEMLPLILFFAVYQMDGKTLSVGDWQHTIDGIFSATAAMMIATTIQVIVTRVLTGQLEKRLLWTTVAVLVFGGATLLFRDERFIQWKPTVFNWVLMLIFVGSQFIGQKNLVERLMGSQIDLPGKIWSRVCWLWSAHFGVVGTLNIVVAYRYSESVWVSYKMYSAIGFTLLLMVLTAALIGPHLKREMATEDTP